jgi:hypothetical protein
MPQKPLTAVEKVQNLFNEFANTLLSEIGEVVSIGLVVDWSIGKSDFPPGILKARENDFTATDLLSMAQQSAKMTQFLHATYLRAMSELAQKTTEATQQLNDTKRNQMATRPTDSGTNTG